MDPIHTLKYVIEVLAQQRFVGLDQNPKGIRDLLTSATFQVEAKINELNEQINNLEEALENANREDRC